MALSAFGHIAGMIGDGGVAFARGVEPDFVRAGGPAVEFEAERFKPFNNFALLEAGQASHQALTING